MRRMTIHLRGMALWIIGLALLGVEPAQTVQLPSLPAAAPSPSASAPERNVPAHLWREQKRIWSSPAHLSRRQLPLLAAAGSLTAILIASDRHVSAALPSTGATVHDSRVASNIGISILMAEAGSVYLNGWRTGSLPRRERGLTALESVANTAIVTELLKWATRRQRPLMGSGDGHFWAGGTSFPSGHASMGWAVAESLAEEYPHSFWIRWGSWSTAAAVSVLRVTGQEHFPSDVFVGALVGGLIAHDVVSQRGAVAIRPLLQTTPDRVAFGVEIRF